MARVWLGPLGSGPAVTGMRGHPCWCLCPAAAGDHVVRPSYLFLTPPNMGVFLIQNSNGELVQRTQYIIFRSFFTLCSICVCMCCLGITKCA